MIKTDVAISSAVARSSDYTIETEVKFDGKFTLTHETRNREKMPLLLYRNLTSMRAIASTIEKALPRMPQELCRIIADYYPLVEKIPPTVWQVMRTQLVRQKITAPLALNYAHSQTALILRPPDPAYIQDMRAFYNQDPPFSGVSLYTIGASQCEQSTYCVMKLSDDLIQFYPPETYVTVHTKLFGARASSLCPTFRSWDKYTLLDTFVSSSARNHALRPLMHSFFLIVPIDNATRSVRTDHVYIYHQMLHLTEEPLREWTQKRDLTQFMAGDLENQIGRSSIRLAALLLRRISTTQSMDIARATQWDPRLTWRAALNLFFGTRCFTP